MNITIRPAKSADAPRWEEIHSAGWEYAYRGILDDDYLDATKEKFRNNVSKTAEFLSNTKGIELVAVDEQDLIVGIMGGHMSVTENGEKIFELHGLYLNPKYIGHGLGKKLFKEFVDWVKKSGGNKCVVWCLEKNKSCGFYKNLGGTELQRRMFKEKYPEILFQIDLEKLKD